MTTDTTTFTGTLAHMECGKCGVMFGMTPQFIQERREDHRTWYCPNGHHRHYPAKNTEERLRAQLRSAENTLAYRTDQLDMSRRSAAAIKGHATRLRRKIERGECPECGQVFKRLATHMKAKHPASDSEATV